MSNYKVSPVYLAALVPQMLNFLESYLKENLFLRKLVFQSFQGLCGQTIFFKKIWIWFEFYTIWQHFQVTNCLLFSFRFFNWIALLRTNSLKKRNLTGAQSITDMLSKSISNICELLCIIYIFFITFYWSASWITGLLYTKMSIYT